jgi:hypothetical protein
MLALSLLAATVAATALTLAPASHLDPVTSTLAWAGWVIGVAIVTMVAAEAFELVELVMYDVPDAAERARPRRDGPAVSVHVPICSEPPDVVQRTLLALHALEYESFEVLVIDNNTADERLWRPVERLCHELGPRFRFFHLARWPGFKAGALNFALTQTSAAASIIAIVDADYEVSPDFIANLIDHFADARVGFVQAPQDYRGWDGRYVGRMCYWEYWQFFAVSMRLRQRRNAILMHGTMVLIRKAALARAGAWAEWCLTEDSEMGLRLLAAGYTGVYCPVSYGWGLVPFSFESYLRQRRRWVMGGAQSLGRHWRWFIFGTSPLSAAQKLHYLQGWAPWMRDGLVVASMPFAIGLSVLILATGRTPDAMSPLASSLLILLAYLALRQVAVYIAYLRRPWTDAAAAGHAIFGMICTVGVAWLRGWQQATLTFDRTPKEPQPSAAASPVLFASFVSGAMLLLLSVAMVLRFGGDGVLVAAGLAAYAVICLALFAAELIDRRPAPLDARCGADHVMEPRS